MVVKDGKIFRTFFLFSIALFDYGRVINICSLFKVQLQSFGGIHHFQTLANTADDSPTISHNHVWLLPRQTCSKAPRASSCCKSWCFSLKLLFQWIGLRAKIYRKSWSWRIPFTAICWVRGWPSPIEVYYWEYPCWGWCKMFPIWLVNEIIYYWFLAHE